MAADCREEDPATVCVANPSHLKIEQTRDSSIDFISPLPDDILHHIFSFIPTDLAIRTSVLSKRWRHVWFQTPCLFFKRVEASRESINKTLASYSATKIMSFHLQNDAAEINHHVNSLLIEFAISRNVEKLSLRFDRIYITDYSFPDCFFNHSSLKQLTVESHYMLLKSTTTVSWTSLKNLSFRYVRFPDESLVKIISGCPMLESLTLEYCQCSFQYLDLSKSLRLTRLDIDCRGQEPMQIMAPHIRYLRLRTSHDALCTLVDFSSLTEADLDICSYVTWKKLAEPDSLQVVMVQKMLEKLRNVEKLTVGMDFVHILSLSELSGVPLPILKVKTLILETKLSRSVVPGIARLVQSSPGLTKIIVYIIPYSTFLVKCVNRYLESKELNPDQCWRSEVEDFPTEPCDCDVVEPELVASCDCEVVEPKLVASLMELLMAKSRTLETLVVYRSGTSRKRFQIARVKRSEVIYHRFLLLVASASSDLCTLFFELLGLDEDCIPLFEYEDEVCNPELSNRWSLRNHFPTGRKVHAYLKLEYLVELAIALKGTMEMETIMETQFGSLFKIPLKKLTYSVQLVDALLARHVECGIPHEAWFVFGIKLMKFLLREFCIVTVLKVHPYDKPNIVEEGLVGEEESSEAVDLNAADIGGEGSEVFQKHWDSLISKDNPENFDKLLNRLNTEKDMEGWKRLQLARFTILDGILLGANQYSYVIEETMEKVKDMKSFCEYPWGRKSFEMMMKNFREIVKRKDLKTRLTNPTVSMRGFPLAIQLLAFETIPKLVGQLINMDFNGFRPPFALVLRI